MGGKALLVVDIQNDFVPGGALAVPKGDEVVGVANRMIPKFDLVVATQDWHPKGHGSFASTYPGKKAYEKVELGGLPQVLWPDHCVQGSRGADFVKGLETRGVTKVFLKGTDPGIDSYSAFFDNGHKKATGLGDWLRAKGVSKVWVLGLATDYCVRFTALDARKLGFETTLIEDGCRAVELQEGDGTAAVSEMKKAGVKVVASAKVS